MTRRDKDDDLAHDWEEDVPHEVESVICSTCSGSGEGLMAGWRCPECKGSGEVEQECEETEDEDEDE